MGQNGGPPRFTLQAPLESSYVATARMFAASVARQFDMDEETIEDLKLAISEACARAVASGGKEGRLAVSAEHRGDRLVFEIAQGTDSPGGDPLAEALDAGLHLELIGALFQDAESATSADGTPVIRFSAG